MPDSLEGGRGWLGRGVRRDAGGRAGPSRAADVQQQAPEKRLSTQHGGTWAEGSTRDHGGLTEQGRTGPGWAWGCLAHVVWGLTGLGPQEAFLLWPRSQLSLRGPA